MSSNNLFESHFRTAIENVPIVAFVSQEFKKIKAIPLRLAYNLISAFVVRRFTQTHTIYTIQT